MEVQILNKEVQISIMFQFLFLLFLTLCNFKIGSLNLNRSRADSKRAMLFKLIEMKRIDVTYRCEE